VAFALAFPAGYTVERLDTAVHDRNDFSCGVEALDTFLRTQAAQDQNKNTSTCHVLVEANASEQRSHRPVVGYVSLANAALALTDAPESVKKITKHATLPALLLARMAVDSRHKGRRLGEFLLKYALKTGCDISEVSGCFAVLVDAKDEGVKSFYVKYGFEPLPDRPLRLFITIATAKKAM
jgi:GNAT superfamily N-acetyltransferase